MHDSYIAAGFGYHGDFLNGWQVEVLQSAIKGCTNLSGRIEDCSVFNIQTAQSSNQCTLQLPKALRQEDCLGPRIGLCGNITM